jgi:hypothetical protein
MDEVRPILSSVLDARQAIERAHEGIAMRTISQVRK